MKTTPFRLHLWTLLLPLLLLGSCGFHLRGSVTLPQVLQRTLVEGDQFSLLVRELEAVLQQSGATLVENSKDATAVLRIVNETGSRRVLSVGSTGKAAEYEVYHSVVYQLEDSQGQILEEARTLSTQRDYQFNETQVLGKSVEEENLREEMQRDLARRIVQQLSIVAR